MSSTPSSSGASISGCTATSGGPSSIKSTTSSSPFNPQQQTQSSGKTRSPLGRAMDSAKAKMTRKPSGSEQLAGDEENFEQQKKKAIKKAEREEEYERLGLGEKTVFGTKGAGGWGSG